MGGPPIYEHWTVLYHFRHLNTVMLKFHLGPRQGCRERFVPTSFCSPIIVLDEAAERATALWGCANVCARDWDLKALYTSLTSCSHSIKGGHWAWYTFLFGVWYRQRTLHQMSNVDARKCCVDATSTERRRSVEHTDDRRSNVDAASTIGHIDDRRRSGSTFHHRCSNVDETSKFSNEQLP